MASPGYDHYTYTPTSDVKQHPHNYDAVPDLPPEDEAFNPATIPKAYADDPYETQGHYQDEETGKYAQPSHGWRTASEPAVEDPAASLVHNAGNAGQNYQNMEYSDPYNADAAKPVAAQGATPISRFMGLTEGNDALQRRIDMKRRGIGRQRYPYVVWILTLAMVITFVIELVANKKAQGSLVSFKPVVNYMIGPSSTVLINVGARFPPCMKLVDAVPPTMAIGCTNNTANPPTEICAIADICGFGGVSAQAPNQWFRFILPIFLHAGVIHLLLNMLAQLSVSAQVEREMGSAGFLITYFAAGIFGNVLGANFALVGRPSVGASGAIFGTVALTWVDLFAHWKYHYRPGRKLLFMTIELLIGVAIGYIPYVDNFAHLGGFLMALLVGTVFYPIISVSKRHKIVTGCVRLVALPIAVVLFVVLIRNFYTADPYSACQGCRYLSCWPTASNDHCQGTGLTTSSSSI